MSVNPNYRKNQYTANGVTTAYSYTFEAVNAADLAVYVDDTLKTLTTHYTVSGAGSVNGGTVTFLVAPANAAIVTIISAAAEQRTTTFAQNGPYFSGDINQELDNLVIAIQQLQEISDRSFKVSTTANTGQTFTITGHVATRANTGLGFDASGNLTTFSNILVAPQTLVALEYVRVNSAATGYELRTPAQTLADIGGDNASLLINGTVSNARLTTNLTTIGNLGSIANMLALNGLISAADTLGYFSGSGTASSTSLTAQGRSLIGGSTASAQRTTLGLGTIAVQDASNVAITGGSITGMSNPSGSTDVANKAYVDAMLAALGKRGNARVATTANVNLASGGIANGTTIDGVSLATGDIVLVKSQTATSENGVYDVPASGAASRSVNYDTWAELMGSVTVMSGNTIGQTFWLFSNATSGTLGTTAITFTQVFPGSGGTITSITGSNGVKTTSGVAITTTGNFELDIAGLTTNASPALTDPLAYYLTASTIPRKISFQGVYDLLNSLTQDTAPDISADYVHTYDTSAGSAKRVLLHDLVMIQQNSQSTAYTLVLADANKHVFHPGADTTARTFTIPANSSVAFPIGTVVTFVNDTSAGVITIAITTDTLVFAGSGSTGSRTLAANGLATAIKITSTKWMISGTGLT